MENQAFDQFCTECNMFVETNVIAEGKEEFLNNQGLPLDLDDQYNGNVYYISLCSRCKQPFMIHQEYYGVAGTFETMTAETLLYPKPTNIEIKDLPKLLQSSYQDASKSFSASLYEPCVLMCRKTLEVICKLNDAKGNNLYKRLDNLKELGHIDQKLLDWSHQIRSIGNDAAHDVYSEISKEDARDALDLTEAILLYIFSLSSRFENFKKRRLELETKKSNKNLEEKYKAPADKDFEQKKILL